MKKQLAALLEQRCHHYVQIMQQINEIAVVGGLQKFDTYCRIWEYPWVWFQLGPLKGRGLTVLDVGSERSPFPWFLATQGFNLIVSDVTADYWRVWQEACRHLEVTARKRILDVQEIDLPTAGVDIYLSASVIEHVQNKGRVIAEAARVLKPGGLLIMTFDICEPDMEMTFPEWNGRALTMTEFDDLFANSNWFEPGLPELLWNTNDIPDYLAWNRTTAPHHNYVTAAAAVRRNALIWRESRRVSLARWIRSTTRASRRRFVYALELLIQGVRQRFPVRTTARRIWHTLRKSA